MTDQNDSRGETARELASLRRRLEERERIDGLIARAVGLSDPEIPTPALLRELVTLIAEGTGMEAVGLRLREGDDFPYFHTRGLTEEFVRLENSLCPRKENGEPRRDERGALVLDCVCGGVLQGRIDRSESFFTEYGSFWSNSNTALVTERPRLLEEIRGNCIRAGYESSALIPLRFGTTTYGLLQLEDKRPGMFTPELLGGLERIALHLGLALSQRQAVEELRRTGTGLEQRVRERTAELRDSEERFRTLVESAPDAIFVQAGGRFAYVNPAAARLLCDAGPGDILGTPVVDCFHPSVAHIVRERIRRLNEERQPVPSSEMRYLKRDGSPLDVDVSAVPFAYAGEPGALVFMRDASERRQAGEALRRAKDEAERALEDMAFIVEAADLGLWSNEWPLGALNWNRQVKEHFWLPPDHQPVIGEFFDILHPDDREPAQRAIDKAVADRGLFDATYRTVAPDGRQRWVRAMGRAIYGEDGSPVRFSGITQDVTAQKRLEADLRRSRDELEARVEERTRELQAKNKELQDFSFIASHDLQEPLRKVQAFGQRLREEFAACLGDDGRDYLRRMERAADRMQRLISDLLEYSRVATRTSPFVMSDLGEVARDALADLEQRIEETGGAIDVGDLPAAEVDRTQMRQVFQNLFANALKYHGPEPPRIRVDGEAGVRGDREVVRVRVRDNGIGFEEQFADRIFQPFQRLHGKNAYEGTGIGLAIVRKVVARHGGTVTAEGRPGQGATFIVELPRSQRQP